MPDSAAGWNHNGYTAYLRYTGLLGFLTYAVFLPYDAVRKCTRLYQSKSIHIRRLAMLTTAFVAFVALQSALTPGLLAGMVHGEFALLLGAIQQIYYTESETEPAGSESTMDAIPSVAHGGQL